MIATIIIIVVVVLLVLWVIRVQNSLVKADEFCKNALKQINVQQMSRFDALKNIVGAVREAARMEGENYAKVISERKLVSSANPSVADINANEAALQAMKANLIAIAEQYPDLKATEQYRDVTANINRYEENVRMSRMTFNDTVTKYNRVVRSFPTSIVASLLKFPVREYLQDEPSKADAPDLFPSEKA